MTYAVRYTRTVDDGYETFTDSVRHDTPGDAQEVVDALLGYAHILTASVVRA